MTNETELKEPPVAKKEPAKKEPAVTKQESAPTKQITKPDELLVKILSTKRSGGSKGDTNFRLWLHAMIKQLGYDPQILAEGTIFVGNTKSTTLFSCHVDTVHGATESDGSLQELAFDPEFDHIMLADKTKSRCLGADDGAGIYIMLKMLAAKVPGNYIFNTFEETGGRGARAMVHKHPALFEDMDRAIAFDRAGDHEVICTQGGQQCASLKAGEALSRALTAQGLKYEVSHKGSFTDTKVFSDYVPECFNLGVGYYDQHTPNEYLDVAHLEKLLAACIKLDWSKCPTERQIPPPYVAPPPFNGGAQSRSMFSGLYDREEDDVYDLRPERPKAKAAEKTMDRAGPVVPVWNVLKEAREMSHEEVTDLVDSDPSVAADLICLLLAKLTGKEAEVAAFEKFFT